MCRFLAYQGQKVLLADLLYNSENSIISQSRKAKETHQPVNADGFGLGWYNHEIEPNPCVIKSILPAWSSSNLRNLSRKILTNNFFAHVRAASPGSPVTIQNCHPFVSGNLMFMHNGIVWEFPKVRRKFQNELSDENYENIVGSTDSEHIFWLFINFLKNDLNPTKEELISAMQKTFAIIIELQNQAETEEVPHLNFALTDGKNLLATKFTSNKSNGPVSLYYALPEKIEVKNKELCLSGNSENRKAILVASEPLSDEKVVWQSVPNNSIFISDENLNYEILPIEI